MTKTLLFTLAIVCGYFAVVDGMTVKRSSLITDRVTLSDFVGGKF